MTPEQKLEAFLSADRPSPRDFAFEVEVARRVAVRRAWLTGLALVPWSVIGAILLWAIRAAVAPRLGNLAEASIPWAMALTLAGCGAMAALWLSRRFGGV